MEGTTATSRRWSSGQVSTSAISTAPAASRYDRSASSPTAIWPPSLPKRARLRKSSLDLVCRPKAARTGSWVAAFASSTSTHLTCGARGGRAARPRRHTLQWRASRAVCRCPMTRCSSKARWSPARASCRGYW